jgi:hypothetical protein
MSVLVVVVLLASWGFRRLARKRHYRYTLKELLLTVTAACVFFLVWPVIWMGIQSRPQLAVSASDWFGIDSEVMRHALKLEKGSWSWAAVQWFAGGGAYAGPLLSLLLVGLWYALRAARRAEQSTLRHWTERYGARFGGLLRCLGHSVATVACLLLVVYLWIAPNVVGDSQADYQYRIEYLDRENEQWQSTRALIAELEADPTIVKEIRAVIEDENLAAEENVD